jgi:acetylcholinesterase
MVLDERKPNAVPDPEATREFTMAAFDSFNPPESEDCPYLNVYALPSVPPLGGYSVMFWVYGGSLQFGDAGQPTYGGPSLPLSKM